MIRIKNTNLFFIALVTILVLISGCSKKITPPDTSDIPDSLKYTLEDALVGRGTARADLGDLYYDGKLINKNFKKALFWYELAGKDGDYIGQYNAAIIYSFEVDDKDYPDRYNKALYWFKKAAENGNVDAQIQLAHLYFKQFKNYSEALSWMKKAAKTKFMAMYDLGSMYDDKNTPYYNQKISFEWFKKAAENGVVNAMYLIGHNYAEGKIVKKDYTLAYKWIKKSVNEAGFGSNRKLFKESQNELKELEKKLTPEQIAAVNKELGYKN